MASQSKVKAGHAYILVEALDRTSAIFGNITRKLDALSQRFLFTARQASILGAALSLPLITSINSARNFSDEILFLQSKLEATDEQMVPLINKIKELGRTTSFTAKEVAMAATSLAQGGFSINMIRDSLDATLDMARGARMELGRTADILVDTLTLFGMKASQASEVADKFFIAARRGTIEVAELAQSFSYSALSAHEMGFTLEETLSILAESSKLMLKSTKAGTSLNQFFTSLASNLDKVKGKLKIEVFDPSGEPRKGTDILRDFAAAISKMTTEERIPIVEEIFNVRGARAAIAIMRSIEGIMEGIDEMNESVGIAAKSSALMDSGIGGSIRRMLSAFDLLKIEVGLAMEEMLKDVENTIRPVINGMSIWAQKNYDAILSFVKIVGSIVAFGAAMTVLGISTRVAAIAISGIGSLVRVATIPVRLLTKAFTLLTAITVRLVKTGLRLVIGTLSLLGRLIILPIELVFRFARVLIFATMAAVQFSISLIQSIVRSGKFVIATFTSFISLIGTVAKGIFTLTATILNLSLTITENLASSLIKVGKLLFDFGLILLNSVGVWLGAVNNLFATFTIGLIGLLTTATGLIATLIGQAIAFAGPIIALGALIAVFAAIGYSIGFLVAQIKNLYNAARQIIESLAKISVHVVELANTTIRFVIYLIRNSLPSLQEFIGKTFSAVVSSAKAMWEDLVFTVNTSLTTIRSLIERGDLEGAFKLVMIGLKFLWESTLIEMQILWKRFSTEGAIVFRNLAMEANIAWMKFRGQFSASIAEIYIELQNIVNAITQVIGVLYDSLRHIASFLGPVAVGMMDAIGGLLADLSEETKNLFEAIRRGQELDRQRRERAGPTPEEIEIDKQIAAMREAAKRSDAYTRSLLEHEIVKLEAAKKALRRAYEEEVEKAGVITFEVKGTETEEDEKPKPLPDNLPPDFAAAMLDISKTNAGLPEALVKGSLAAEEKSAQNQQISLLSSIAHLLESIDSKTKKDSDGPPIAGAIPIGV